jgi:type IV secretory pathway VirB4 component
MAAPLTPAAKQELGSSLDLVDIQEIKENTVILKDGGLRQVIMVGGVNFALKSDSEQNIITQAYQTFLNGIDFPLQILIHSRKVNIDKYIEGLVKRKGVEESPILQNQIDEYAEFIKSFVQKNAIMEKTFLVVIPFYAVSVSSISSGAKGMFDAIPFFGKKKDDKAAAAKTSENAKKTFGENVEQLNQRTTQAMNGLLSIGLEATLLTDEALVELFYNFYNPQTVERQDMPIARE